jgi:DNA polymerase III subunit chi
MNCRAAFTMARPDGAWLGVDGGPAGALGVRSRHSRSGTREEGLAEILFYHLTATALEASLPEMLERSLARGWRVILRCGSPAGMAGIDAMLWTYSDTAFLPHGTAASPHAALQTVYLTLGEENPNRANVLMLVDGARGTLPEMSAFERTCLIFDGQDERAVEAARADWRAVTAAALPAKYWAQERGRWVQKG